MAPRKLARMALLATALSLCTLTAPALAGTRAGAGRTNPSAVSAAHQSVHAKPKRRHDQSAKRSTASSTSAPRTSVSSKSAVSTSAASTSAPSTSAATSPDPIAQSAQAAPSQLAGIKLYVDPDSEAAAQEVAWQSSDPAGAAAMATLAAQPTADWFGGWDTDVTADVDARVSAAAASGEVAELVAYDIPQRDCDGYSSGGATSAAAYETWIDEFAAGIGSDPAIVILEPDALAGIDCLSAADQATRLSLLSYAVSTLSAHAGVKLYLDAGHAGWQTPAVMAARLQQAGIAQADGFSLNVSNFDATSNEEAYGQAISALVGGKHFVIDTSRNGDGSGGQWCNPPGRALGAEPTTSTGDGLVDAFLWIKTPGESDGTCNGGPAAGSWWPASALNLVQSSSV